MPLKQKKTFPHIYQDIKMTVYNEYSYFINYHDTEQIRMHYLYNSRQQGRNFCAKAPKIKEKDLYCLYDA